MMRPQSTLYLCARNHQVLATEQRGDMRGDLGAGGRSLTIQRTARVRWRTIVVATAVAVGAGCSGGGDDGGLPPVTRPADWPDPEADVAASTSEYLSGEGTVVVAVLDHADTLADGGDDQAVCEEVADSLGAAIDQDGYRAAAAGIPDPVLRELALSAATSVADVLAACLDGDGDLDEVLAQLRQVNDVIDLRREELG
jgi:hypothetical protein